MQFIQRIKDYINEKPILRKIARNFGYVFSSNIIAAGLSMLQGIFSVRLLGVLGFGLLGTITVFASTINKITSFRMGELVIKYVGHFNETGNKEKAAAAFKSAVLSELLASFIAFGLTWLLAVPGATYLGKDDSLAYLFVVYGLVNLFNMFTESSTGLLQLFDHFKNMAWLNISQSVITLLLIILAWWQQWGLLGILVAYMAGKAFTAFGLAIASFNLASRKWGRDWWHIRINVLTTERRSLLRFAFSTNINSTLGLIRRDSSVLWVSYFANPEQVGYYKLALALANYIQVPMAPMPQVTYPELALAVVRKKWEDFRYILKQGSLIAGIYSLLVGLSLAVFGKPLISWLYGAELLPSYNGLMIMLIGIIFANTFYWARSALLSFGLANYATRVNAVLTLITVAGYILLLPVTGQIGAAILMTFGNLFSNGIIVWRAFRKLSVEEKQNLAEESPA